MLPAKINQPTRQSAGHPPIREKVVVSFRRSTPPTRVLHPTAFAGGRGMREGDDDEEEMDPVADDLVRIQRLLEHMEK